MELLQAVNTVLPHLGEHVVTRVEGSKHPTVDLITAAIDRHRLGVLSEGLWFNEIHLTIPVNTDGQIAVPSNVLAVYGDGCNVEMYGEVFLNLDTGGTQFTDPIKVKLVQDVPFDKLPVSLALYLTYAAGTEVYLQDFGYEKHLPLLQQLANQHWVKVSQENLRKRKFNSLRNTRARYSQAVKFR